VRSNNPTFILKSVFKVKRFFYRNRKKLFAKMIAVRHKKNLPVWRNSGTLSRTFAEKSKPVLHKNSCAKRANFYRNPHRLSSAIFQSA